MIIIRVIIFATVVKIFFETENAWACAAILAGVTFFLGSLTGLFAAALVSSLVNFVLALGYFFLLGRLEEGVIFWVVIILGALMLM